MPGRGLAHQPIVQRVVRLQIRLQRLYAPLDNVLERLVLAQPHRQVNALAHSPPVKRLLQVVVVQERLRIRVGGCEFQLARAQRQIQRHNRAYAQRLHSRAAAIHPLGGE